MAAQTGPSRKSDASTVWAVSGLIVLLFLLFLTVLVLSVLRDWRETEGRVSERASAATQIVATNARWLVELSRQSLARVDEALGPNVELNDATAALINDAVATLPGTVHSYVIDAQGRILFSTDPRVEKIDLLDREYFTALRSGEFWHFSPLLISRINGNQIFVISKRLTRHGAFAGAAIIVYDAALMKETWNSLRLNDISTVSLVRNDGQLVARYPQTDGSVDLSNYVLFTDYLPRSDVGTYPAVSPVDGESRIVAYKRVEGTPYVALASLSRDNAFARFHRTTLTTLLLALPAATALAGAAIWIIRLLRREQERREQLAQALDLNRMLVKDTYHRVKNNLQAVMSLVRMHALPGELKADLQSRIAAMSTVHESLYRMDQFQEIDAVSLVRSIVDPLRQTFAPPVAVAYEVDPVLLDRDSATPFALVLSEVVANALKYAFPDGRQGTISISFKREASGGGLLLAISDDGIGFDPAQAAEGMGSRIIKAMIVQLGGRFQYVAAKGTRFEAELPAAILANAQA